MQKLIFVFFFSTWLCSCSKTGDYYSMDKDGEVENMQLLSNEKAHIDFVANIIGADFNVMLYFKLIDTSIKDYQIKDISFEINNVTDSLSAKTLNCINVPNQIRFSKINNINALQQKINTGFPLQFIYKFTKDDVRNKSEIRVNIKLRLNENNKDVLVEKEFKMYRNARYRTWLATS